MSAKEFLDRIKTMDLEIDNQQAELDRLEALASRITSDTMPVAVLEMRKEINDKIDELVNLKREARAKIEQLKNPKHRIVLGYYYLCNMTMEQVADRTGRDLRSIYRLRDRVLDNLCGWGNDYDK